jgi:hypothetical protein
MSFIGNTPSLVPLSGSQIADGTIVNANIATSTINLTQKVTATLPVAQGGTGVSTLGTAGQALVVNSSATALQFSTVGATAGQVIQVLSATDSTTRTTTSTSFVTASNTLSVTITPSSASNKILILISSSVYGMDVAVNYYTIYRGSTNLGTSNGFASAYNGAGGLYAPLCMNYLDSPATTSAITYQVYMRIASSGNTAYVNADNTKGSITCMEVKG